MTDWRKRRDRYVDDPDLGAIMELEPIEIEGSVSRANTIELDPIGIVGSRSADVEPFDGGVRMPDGTESRRGPRRDDGVSRLVSDTLGEWVQPWMTEVVGQPVEGMGGTTDWEVPEWVAENMADSEGQMPQGSLDVAATAASNLYLPAAIYRHATGVDPSREARTISPMSALAGMADTGSMGLVDDISGFSGVGLDTEDYRREQATTQRQNPGSYLLGEVAGAVPQMFVPSAAAGRGATTAARAGYAALEGGAYGAIEGMARSNAPTLMGRAQDAIPGAVGGAVLGGGLGALGARTEQRAAQPVDQRAVDRVLDQAALERLGQSGGSQALSQSRMRRIAPGSTPRERIQSARRTVDRMHEYGAFDGVLPPGPEVIAQRVDAQRTRGLENMDRVTEGMAGEQVEAQRVLTHLQDRVESLDAIPGAEREADSMRALLARFQARADQGPMSMSDLQAWKSHYQRRHDPNASSVPQEEAGDLLMAITGNMQDAVTGVDPALGRQYQQGRHDEFIGRGFDEMLGDQTMEAARLRKFSLSDYMTGLAGFSGENGGVVRGLIGIAANRGLRRNEHGLAAMSLERTARRLQSAPQRFGRQAAMLQAALKRGPQAFAAALYIAQQNDEAVRAAMAEEEDVAGMRERATEAVPTMDEAIEDDINSIPTMDDL